MTNLKTWGPLALLFAGALGAACAGGGDAVEPICGEGTVAGNGACIPDLACGAGTRLDPGTGDCVPDPNVCAAGSILVDGRCQAAAEAIEPDAVEAAEQDDLRGDAGTIPLPDVGADPFIASGCVTTVDLDGDGVYDWTDRDPWRLSTDGPVIVELETIGVGGLALAIAIDALDRALMLDRWQRSAMDTVDGHSRWQFLLPTAGDYDLVVTDARTLIADLPAGGPESCYFVMVRQLPLPEPAAIPSPVDVFELESGVRFYTIDVAAGSMTRVIGETPRISTRLGLTLLVDGEYIRSVEEDNEYLRRAALLDIADSYEGAIVVAVDASIDFAYAPVLARVLEQDLTAAGLAGGRGAR